MLQLCLLSTSYTMVALLVIILLLEQCLLYHKQNYLRRILFGAASSFWVIYCLDMNNLHRIVHKPDLTTRYSRLLLCRGTKF